MRISVLADKAGTLRTLLAAMRTLDRDVKKHMRRETRAMIAPEWKQAVAENANTRLEHLVLANTARVAVSDRNVTLKSAHIGRPLRGGMRPSEGVGAVEFGMSPRRSAVTQTSRRGRSYSYTRTAGNQFRARKRTGYVVYPAAAAIIPRLASLWVQTAVRSFHEAAEKAERG